MSREQLPTIDWSLTTYDGSRKEQLRRNQQLTLRERFLALENMAELSRRLAALRAQDGLREPSKTSGSSIEASNCDTGSAAQEPTVPKRRDQQSEGTSCGDETPSLGPKGEV
ncbi:MAG: hypothetical protein A2284_05645 [Deltaproteobacteria bacterium RIFOXYA12_FULL_61_11]|nr:MAG: hypothetical protein A2284_05645 [Deltaproteobacteria bacterium RIFOXYA12_FULL_61_11]